MDYHFVSMRFKNQAYLGRQAIAVYINNETRKIHEKLYRIQQQEREQYLA